MTALEPKPSTPRKYGLSLDDWREMLADQGGVCAVCERLPPSRRLVIDHVHVKGFRRMPPEQRRRYVRGLLCPHCNHRLLGRFVTLEKARRVVMYLAGYQLRAV